MNRLKIYFLGEWNVTLDGKSLARLGTQKARALFAYLVMHPNQALSREKMAPLLWGDFPEERARHNLRQAIHTLRQELDPFLIVEPDSATFDAESDHWFDVRAFTQLSSQSSIESLTEAIDLYRGEFLAGLVVRDSLAFEEWLFFERDRLAHQYLTALGQLSDMLAAAGDFDRAIEYTMRLVSHDPLQEHAHRQLMRLYHQSGNRNAALQQYQTCKETLAQELGAEPEQETTELYRQIKESDTAPDRALPLDARSRYHLKEILGRGSSGIVRTAQDTLLNRPVTLKLLTSVADDPQAARRLLDAASQLAQLTHPNVASIYDAGYLGETPYVALQPAIGTPLSDLPPLPLTGLLDAMEQTASALEHAHERGILHGDVRPASIFVGDDGTVQIVGFTLVPQKIDSDLSLKEAAYLPPELAQGRRPDRRADLYQLGVTLYELATGRLPFTGETPLAIVSQHVDVTPVPPRSRQPNLPPDLEAVILRLMAKRPQDRYPSADEVGKALQAIRRRLEGQAAIEQAAGAMGEAPTASLLDRIARGRLFGRTRELEELKTHWQRAEGGQPHLLLLSGELGVGKTRLARELVVYARLRGATALWGRCYEQEVTVPYRPFTDAFQDYFATQPVETLRRQIGASAAELTRLVPQLLERLGPIEPNPPLRPHEERMRLFDHVAAFLRNLAAERPVLLFLDDLHWADEASLLLLQHLTRHVYAAPFLLLGAYRETELSRKHPLRGVLVELNRERLVTRLPLRRLDRAAVSQMINAMCSVEIAPAVVDAIYQETEGNPFFVEEVVKAMVEEEAFAREPTPRPEQDWTSLRIPQSINATISRRLERVSPESGWLLAQAAIVGRRFPLDLLLAVTDLEEETALDALDEAVAAQLVRPPRPGKGQIYAFQHALIAQTLYEEWNARRRARLHGRVGRAIESLYPENLDNWLEELAYHFAQTYGDENEEKAIVYNIRAGDRARHLYAHEQALRYYGMALELLEDRETDARQGRIWEAIGDISYLISRYESALSAYDRALKYAQAPTARAALNRKIGLIHDRRGRYDEALEYLERALVPLHGADGQEAIRERALIWANQADTYFRLGQLARAREICLAGLTKLQDSSHHAQLAFLHRTLGSVALRQGETQESLDHHRKSLEMAQRANDVEGIVAARANLGGASRLAGRWDQAIAWGQQALALAERVGNYRGMSFAHSALGTTRWQQGHLSEARQHVEQGLRIAERIQDRNQVAQLQIYLALIQLHVDPHNLPQARERLARARGIAQELGSHSLLSLLRVAEAETYLREKDWDRTIRVLGQAAEMEDAAPWLKSDYHQRLALAYLGKGETQEALSHARRALETATAHGYPFEIATSEQALARALAQSGQTQAAIEHLTAAIARFETLGSRRALERARNYLREIEN
jgi:DNA-binding SARP family transcriptional activator